MAYRLPTRKWLNGVAAIALTGLAATAAPARAETLFGIFSFDVSPAEVAATINRHGYVIRSAIVRRGDVYLADVSGPTGAMERLIVDAHTGRLEQHFAWRGDYYRQGPQSYAAPVPVGGGMFASAPRPEVDIGGPRTRNEEFLGSDDEMRGIRQRQTAYGGDARMPLTQPPALDVKPVDKSKLKAAARPKPAPSASPSTEASVTTPTSPPPRPVTDAPTSTTVVTPAPAVEAAKPVAPPKPQGVVASSNQAESAPVQAVAPAPPPAPAPAPAPPKKSINDIPVAPLD